MFLDPPKSTSTHHTTQFRRSFFERRKISSFEEFSKVDQANSEKNAKSFRCSTFEIKGKEEKFVDLYMQAVSGRETQDSDFLATPLLQRSRIGEFPSEICNFWRENSSSRRKIVRFFLRKSARAKKRSWRKMVERIVEEEKSSEVNYGTFPVHANELSERIFAKISTSEPTKWEFLNTSIGAQKIYSFFSATTTINRLGFESKKKTRLVSLHDEKVIFRLRWSRLSARACVGGYLRWCFRCAVFCVHFVYKGLENNINSTPKAEQ